MHIHRRIEIKDLHAETLDGKQILKGVNLKVSQGSIHAIMGPNGGGKSTLTSVLMGSPDYKITQGHIFVNGEDVTTLSPNERSLKGLFVGFQYPVEVTGVNFVSFLRLCVNEKRTHAGLLPYSPIVFRKLLQTQASLLGLPSLTDRMLNSGFSGGEKKKLEILQMAMLQDPYAILDEPDSGLDVDAMRYISQALQTMEHNYGLVLITHYPKILHYIKPDYVHIFVDGRIVRTGDATLATEIEQKGYEQYKSAN